MLNKEDFITFIIDGPSKTTGSAGKVQSGKKDSALPEGLEGFGFDDEEESGGETHTAETSFARQLVEASGFGAAQYLATAEVILGGDPASQHLPDKVYYWPKAAKRHYQTLLFELTQSSDELLKAPLFRPAKGVLEDALSRLVQDTLKGFEIGGEKRRADVKQGKQEETLCIVSVRDLRDRANTGSHLVCLGTVARGEGSLETFHIREAARFWEPQLARDHLARLYDRHFKKLASEKWQDAFITGEERKLARKLIDVCQGKKPAEAKIQEAAVGLLEEIALSYGLRRKPGGRRLEATDLPQDHDIGIPDDVKDGEKKNPFKGMSLRDEKNRLLGYIIYCLDQKEDAELLKEHLQANNRFHNVLVVYPNGASTDLELWQGNLPLEGKLTKKGARFEGEGRVVNLLSRFFVVSKALVSNPAELAEELAYRARYVRGFAIRELNKPEAKRDKDLAQLYRAFHEIFLKNEESGVATQHKEFADSYAQTLTYGLLSARWISKESLAAKKERFTLENASDLLEKTSPFFKELFAQVISRSHTASRDWLLQDITDLLDRIEIEKVFSTAVEDTQLGNDPVMHFYEPFLEAYNRDLRFQYGVFYTPRPVVSYVVRTAQRTLQEDFGLQDGLASTVTWGEMFKSNPALVIPLSSTMPGQRERVSPETPFVQILDPATGTGTFLVEVIDVIYETMYAKWRSQGLKEDALNRQWNEYVRNDLLPRLYGYELMMASYAIAHLKLALKLADTGYQFASDERANVFLTNALVPPHDFSNLLKLAVPALAHETTAVNHVKETVRFTVVLGNPPYNNFGEQNRGRYILGLLSTYKAGLDERKINLDDDFIKFIRFSHEIINTTGVGLMGFVTNSVYLDGITHRMMRKSLIDSFQLIDIWDLHGNIRRQERCPDGSPDENVFRDIQQGVSVAQFSRLPDTTSQLTTARDTYGLRSAKFATLLTYPAPHKSDVIQPKAPGYYFHTSAATEIAEEYERGYPIDKIFNQFQSPIQTKRDRFTIHLDKVQLKGLVADLKALPEQQIRDKYSLPEDGRDWKLPLATADALSKEAKVIEILYKPFDIRFTLYTGKSKGFLAYPRDKIMRHMMTADSLAFVFKRQATADPCGYSYFFVVDRPFSEGLFKIDPKGREYIAPLWLDTNNGSAANSELLPPSKTNNFRKEFLDLVEAKVKKVCAEKGRKRPCVEPEDILGYIYAVVHSQKYRQRYADLLIKDFPRIPIASHDALFDSLSGLGRELIALHLLQRNASSSSVALVGSRREVSGRIEKDLIDIEEHKDCVRINSDSYFTEVPTRAWHYFIGGNQVCHRWLDERRKNKATLTDDDVRHFQLVVGALNKATEIETAIDETIERHGGFPIE